MDVRVLVAAASKHGATQDIAQRVGRVIAERLGEQGLCAEVDVRDAGDVGSSSRYDAVVLGSAVYAGHWLAPAVGFVTANVEDLSEKPVWLFSSGPIGEPAMPKEEPVQPLQIQRQLRAREHRLFAGRLERARLSFAERAVVKALRAPEGDFRVWRDIDEWAVHIAESLVLVRTRQAG